MDKDPNRKTTIPLKGIPEIVSWLLKNCTTDEIFFMANLAGKRQEFFLLTSILNRLTDHNVYSVFYEKNLDDPVKLMAYRAAKRGEVAGLKAFQMACQAAKVEIEERKEKRKEKSEST
jgi:hypothetical protein